MSNPFEEKYKSYSLIQLVEIIERRNDYQPEAVVAAEEEISRRKLSPAEMEQAQRELQSDWQKEKQRNEKIRAIEKAPAKLLQNLWNYIHPLKKKTSTQVIRILCSIIAISFLYSLLRNPSEVKFMISEYEGWDSFRIFYLAMLIYVPAMILLLWNVKRAGWIMFNLFASYTIFLFLYTWYVQYMFSVKYDFPGIMQPIHDYSMLYRDLPLILIYFGTILFFNRRYLRRIFRIRKTIVILCYSISFILCSLQCLPFAIEITNQPGMNWGRNDDVTLPLEENKNTQLPDYSEPPK